MNTRLHLHLLIVLKLASNKWCGHKKLLRTTGFSHTSVTGVSVLVETCFVTQKNLVSLKILVFSGHVFACFASLKNNRIIRNIWSWEMEHACWLALSLNRVCQKYNTIRPAYVRRNARKQNTKKSEKLKTNTRWAKHDLNNWTIGLDFNRGA